MGMWASGKVAFGVDLNDKARQMFYVETLNEDGEEDYTDDDIANIYFQWCAFQEGVKHPGHFNREKKDYQEFLAAAKRFQEKYPFEINTYGAYSGPKEKHFLYLEGTEQSFDQTNATEISTAKQIDPKIFQEFSDKFNLNLGEPKWCVTVIYG